MRQALIRYVVGRADRAPGWSGWTTFTSDDKPVMRCRSRVVPRRYAVVLRVLRAV